MKCKWTDCKRTARKNWAFCDGHIEFMPRADSLLQKHWDPMKGGTWSTAMQ